MKSTAKNYQWLLRMMQRDMRNFIVLEWWRGLPEHHRRFRFRKRIFTTLRILRCMNCNKKFPLGLQRTVFCSKECHRRSYNRERNLTLYPSANKDLTRECLVCGEVFTSKNKRKKTCSRKCSVLKGNNDRSAINMLKPRSVKKKKVNCKYCHCELMVPLKGHPTRLCPLCKSQVASCKKVAIGMRKNPKYFMKDLSYYSEFKTCAHCGRGVDDRFHRVVCRRRRNREAARRSYLKYKNCPARKARRRVLNKSWRERNPDKLQKKRERRKPGCGREHGAPMILCLAN